MWFECQKAEKGKSSYNIILYTYIHMLSYLSPLVREISLFYSIASTETQPYLLRYYSEINEFQLDWSKFILSRLVGIFFLLLRIVVPPFWPRWLIDDFCRKNWIHCHVDLQLEYSSHTLLTNMLSLFYCRFATQREYAIVASTDADAELDAACIFYPRDISLNDEEWFSYGWIIGKNNQLCEDFEFWASWCQNISFRCCP